MMVKSCSCYSDSLPVRRLDCFHSLQNIILLETAVMHEWWCLTDCYSFSDFQLLRVYLIGGFFGWKKKIYIGVTIWTASMGAVLGRHDTHKRSFHGSKLEAKMVDAMQQRASHGTSLKSFDSIIMKFPKIDESFRKCKTIFEQFGEFCPFACALESLDTFMLLVKMPMCHVAIWWLSFFSIVFLKIQNWTW